MKPLDTVSVLIPPKAEYVSIARLTASGIASRMGFDIDEIEDIKVSISEVINRMIDKGIPSDGINIDFHLFSDYKGLISGFQAVHRGILLKARKTVLLLRSFAP